MDMLEETNLQLVHTCNNDVRCVNMGTLQTSKGQASRCTIKDGKEYVKHHIPGQKNKHLGKRKDKSHSQEVVLGKARQQNTR